MAEKHTVHCREGGKVVIDGDRVEIHLPGPIVVQRKSWTCHLSADEEARRSMSFAATNVRDRILSLMNTSPWRPIEKADLAITQVQDFSEAGITLRNSDRYWVRDEDGRIYEASWSDDKAGYWWDWEGESPVDPVEFMPHPLDPRWTATKSQGGVSHGRD